MRVMRNSVFETNSSSSHTMSIREIDNSNVEIPRNCDSFDICESVQLGYDETVYSELGKLRYLIALISARIVEDVDKGNIDIPDYYNYNYSRSVEGWTKFNEVILGHSWVVWITDLIQDKCNTTLVFGKKSREFPYISDIYSFEDEYTCELLGLKDKDAYDEDKVKAKFEEIIFNPALVIEDRVEEY